MINESFWSSKSVLITGHTGFKGSWLSLWLSELGATVHGYALGPITQPNLYTVAGIDSLVNSHIADIRDAQSLQTFVDSIHPEIVFHLAAQPLVRESFSDPVTTIETNVMGTVNILEAARQCDSIKAVVVVTSDKCYQNNEWQWGYRENEPLGGHDPYSASKACAELIAQSWRLSFMGSSAEEAKQCAIATARAGNVIGGGDWSADRLIPDLLNSIANNEDLVLRNPNAIRPWQHVLEPLAGYMMLAERLATQAPQWAQAWNFGPNDTDARSVSWITDSLIKTLQSATSWKVASDSQPHEAQHLKLDCSKARELLGWSPVWSLSDCLQEIAQWHTAWMDNADMQQVSREAIRRYSKSIV